MEKALYENPLAKVNAHPKVGELLGDVQPLGKMAILEGETKYRNNYQTVKSTVRIEGKNENRQTSSFSDRGPAGE